MQDYCRAVQPSDISLLLPLSKGFEDDVAFHVPALGCAATGHADEAHKAIEAALEHAAAPSLRADLEEGVSACPMLLSFSERAAPQACARKRRHPRAAFLRRLGGSMCAV